MTEYWKCNARHLCRHVPPNGCPSKKIHTTETCCHESFLCDAVKRNVWCVRCTKAGRMMRPNKGVTGGPTNGRSVQ